MNHGTIQKYAGLGIAVAGLAIVGLGLATMVAPAAMLAVGSGLLEGSMLLGLGGITFGLGIDTIDKGKQLEAVINRQEKGHASAGQPLLEPTKKAGFHYEGTGVDLASVHVRPVSETGGAAPKVDSFPHYSSGMKDRTHTIKI